MLADLADQLGLGVAVTEAGRIVCANGAFCALVGYEEAQLIALPSAITLFSPQSRSLFGSLYAEGVTRPCVAHRDLDLIGRDGIYVPVGISMLLEPGTNGSVNTVALVHDRRAAVAGAEEVARFSSLIERLPASVILWDGNGVDDPMRLRLAFANRSARDSLKFELAEVVGKTMADLFPASLPEEAARLLALCGTDRVEHFGEVVYGDTAANKRLYRWQGVALPGGMVAAVFEDVSPERASEARRRDLLHRLLDTSDLERRKLSMDLHDDAVQQIAAASLLVEGLQRHPDSPEWPERLSTAAGALRAALGSLRRLVFELNPPELVESGLETAVKSAAEHLFRETSTDVSIAVWVEDPLPQAIETVGFRIVTEALTNARKHAHARNIRVEVTHHYGQLAIEVVDDGIGIHHSSEPGHIGMRTMQERAAAHGGSCSVSGHQGGGTVVRALIPTGGQYSVGLEPSAFADEIEDAVIFNLRRQAESLSAAAGSARRDAWQARHQLRTAMKLVESLLDPAATLESVTLNSAELLGQALQAGCAVHLLTRDGQQLARAASWHANPELLETLNQAEFRDRLASDPWARTVLTSGEAVLADFSTASNALGTEASDHPLAPHSSIVAPLVVEGATIGTITAARVTVPERLTPDDVDFVKCIAAQIALAIVRTGGRVTDRRTSP